MQESVGKTLFTHPCLNLQALLSLHCVNSNHGIMANLNTCTEIGHLSKTVVNHVNCVSGCHSEHREAFAR